MIKNSLVALCVVLFILASQQPAEAGPIKRAGLLVIKWGVCFPVRWVNFVHILPGYFGFVAGGLGELMIDEAVINDRLKEAAKKEKESLIHKSGYDVPIDAEPVEEPVKEEAEQ